MNNYSVSMSLSIVAMWAVAAMGCTAKSKISHDSNDSKNRHATNAAPGSLEASATLKNIEESIPVFIEGLSILAGEVLVCGDMAPSQMKGLPLSIEVSKLNAGKIEIVYFTQKDEVQSFTYEGVPHKDAPYLLINDHRRTVMLDFDLYERRHNQPKSLWAQGSVAGNGLDDVAFTLECSVKKDEGSESRE